MEILLITLIVGFSFWTWKAEMASRERHTEIKEILTLLKQELHEIKSGVSKEGDTGLNPMLFEIPPETSGIIEQKNQEISELKKSLLLLLYLFHWRTLIWYVQWPYYEIRYWIKHRSRNKDEDS